MHHTEATLPLGLKILGGGNEGQLSTRRASSVVRSLLTNSKVFGLSCAFEFELLLVLLFLYQNNLHIFTFLDFA